MLMVLLLSSEQLLLLLLILAKMIIVDAIASVMVDDGRVACYHGDVSGGNTSSLNITQAFPSFVH